MPQATKFLFYVMQPWKSERGTLWALETDNGLPPFCPARVEAVLVEVGPEDDLDELAAAMNLPTTAAVAERLEGNRRCFTLRVDGALAAYGWLTHGIEYVGELERSFNLDSDEAYIWDCATLPGWRGQRCYSNLLSHLIYRMHQEGIPRIWIGASRQNEPSVKGFANAGFRPVVDVLYCRLYRFTWFSIYRDSSAPASLVSAAYRILIANHERRLGSVALGFKS